MTLKLRKPLLLLVLLALALSACAAPAPVAETVAVEPTAVPATATLEPTATPEPAPDWAALMETVIANNPPDKGYGTVSAAKLSEELAEEAPFLLDVREVAELEKDGYIAGTVNIPVRELLDNLDKLPAQDQPIVIYCASGHRGGMAFTALQMLGYTNVRNLGGGIGAWKKAELPVETGSLPEAPAAGAAPTIENQALLTGLQDYFTNLPEGFATTKSDALNEMLGSSEPPFLLDVRSEKEFAESGYIDGAVNIPMGQVFSSLDQLPAQDAAIVVYCASGHRGAVVAMGLRLLGYANVTNLGGGLGAWKTAQFPVAGWVDWNAVWGEFLSSMPAGYYSVGAADLNAMLAEQAPFLLDVRQPAELENDGYIAGAVNIPVRDVLKNLDKLPAQDQPIVVYCGSGHRGAYVMAALRLLGYTDVVNLGGGIGAWKKAELPVETGSMPEAPAAGAAPTVDETRFQALDAFLSGLPDGFLTVKATDLNAELASEAAPFVLDVRTAEELTKDGYIEGSVNVPVVELFANLAQLPQDKAAPIVVMCKSGHRGALAQMALIMNGYTDVRNLGGGLGAWVAAELPVVK